MSDFRDSGACTGGNYTISTVFQKIHTIQRFGTCKHVNKVNEPAAKEQKLAADSGSPMRQVITSNAMRVNDLRARYNETS